jgi:hypothetical protein
MAMRELEQAGAREPELTVLALAPRKPPTQLNREQALVGFLVKMPNRALQPAHFKDKTKILEQALRRLRDKMQILERVPVGFRDKTQNLGQAQVAFHGMTPSPEQALARMPGKMPQSRTQARLISLT